MKKIFLPIIVTALVLLLAFTAYTTGESHGYEMGYDDASSDGEEFLDDAESDADDLQRHIEDLDRCLTAALETVDEYRELVILESSYKKLQDVKYPSVAGCR